MSDHAETPHLQPCPRPQAAEPHPGVGHDCISIRLPARLQSELAGLAEADQPCPTPECSEAACGRGHGCGRSLESYVLYTLARHVLAQRKANGAPLSIYDLFVAESLATPAPGEQP